MSDFEKTFEQHLGEVRESRRYRLLQGVTTLRHRTLPYMAGLVPGSLLADRVSPGVGNESLWVMIAIGMMVIITPVVYAFTRRHRDFSDHRVFYVEALKRTLLDRSREMAEGRK
jgi:hypothetical protein